MKKIKGSYDKDMASFFLAMCLLGGMPACSWYKHLFFQGKVQHQPIKNEAKNTLKKDKIILKKISQQATIRAKKYQEEGLLSFQKGLYEQAEKQLKQALEEDNRLIASHITLAKIYLMMGVALDDKRLQKKALYEIDSVCYLDPNQSEALLLKQLFVP